MLLSGDAAADHKVIVRFVNTRDAEASALLGKVSGATMHAGGAPWPATGAQYQRVLAWIRGGARLDAAARAEPVAETAAPHVPAPPPRRPPPARRRGLVTGRPRGGSAGRGPARCRRAARRRGRHPARRRAPDRRAARQVERAQLRGQRAPRVDQRLRDLSPPGRPGRDEPARAVGRCGGRRSGRAGIRRRASAGAEPAGHQEQGRDARRRRRARARRSAARMQSSPGRQRLAAAQAPAAAAVPGAPPAAQAPATAPASPPASGSAAPARPHGHGGPRRPRVRAAVRVHAERPLQPRLRAAAVLRRSVRSAERERAPQLSPLSLPVARHRRRSVRRVRRGPHAAVLGGALSRPSPPRARPLDGGRGKDRRPVRRRSPLPPELRRPRRVRPADPARDLGGGRGGGPPRRRAARVRAHGRCLRRARLRPRARRFHHQPAERLLARGRDQARLGEPPGRVLDVRCRRGTRPTTTRSASGGACSCRPSM